MDSGVDTPHSSDGQVASGRVTSEQTELRFAALALSNPVPDVASATEQTSAPPTPLPPDIANLPWLLRLPSEILWEKLVFQYLSPRSVLSVLPRLSQAFRTEFAPFTSRIPVTVNLSFCVEDDISHKILHRTADFGDQETDNQAGFHVFPSGETFEPGWGRLTFHDAFETHTVSQEELDRDGPATPAALRTADFYEAFPAPSQSHSTVIAGKTAQRPYRAAIPNRVGQAHGPLRPISFGTHFAFHVYWHKRNGRVSPVPPFRKVSNLCALVIDSVSAWCGRPVVVTIKDATFGYGCDDHGLALEQVTRGLGSVPRVQVGPTSSEWVRWDGSVVPGVKELVSVAKSHAELKRLSISRWVDTERVKFLVLESCGDEYKMQALSALVSERVTAEADGIDVRDVGRGTGRGRGGGGASQVGSGTAAGALKHEVVPLKEFDLTLYNVGHTLQFTALSTAICSLHSLAVLHVRGWYREDHRPTSLVTFDASDPSSRAAHAAFHSIPTTLPMLRDFGDALNAGDLLRRVAAPGAWRNLKALQVQIAGPDPAALAWYWHHLGQTISGAALELRILRIGGLTVGALAPGAGARSGATAGRLWAELLASALGEGLFGARKGRSQMHALKEVVFGAERNVDLWRGVRDGGLVLKDAYGVEVKTEFVDGLTEKEIWWECGRVLDREWTIEDMVQLL